MSPFAEDPVFEVPFRAHPQPAFLESHRELRGSKGQKMDKVDCSSLSWHLQPDKLAQLSLCIS